MSEFCPWLLTHRGPAKEEKEGYFYGECDIISHLHHTNCFLCEVAQSCPTLCNPMDCCLPGFSVHGIFQARVLEWVAISFSRGSSRPRDRTSVSHTVGRRFTLWATSSLWGTSKKVLLLTACFFLAFKIFQLCPSQCQYWNLKRQQLALLKMRSFYQKDKLSEGRSLVMKHLL